MSDPEGDRTGDVDTDETITKLMQALRPREQEVLELIARGFSYAEIARIKEVTVHTVQTHIKHLYRKLAVRSKNEAVFEATQLGLLQQPRQDTSR